MENHVGKTILRKAFKCFNIVHEAKKAADCHLRASKKTSDCQESTDDLHLVFDPWVYCPGVRDHILGRE